ncbi:MAG: hypothetical protein B7Y39_14150 [Bdellovibrio sp. 28-41-41]|nr:MAG: hypothetical protein B7Y39_14150 [Bdellovibrio sp. 28-41-41]
MANRALLRGLVSSTKNITIALIFSSQSLWAQAPSTSATVMPGNGTTSASAAVKPEEKNKKLSGSVKVTTLGRGIQDQNLKSKVGWTFVEAGVDTEYTDWLAFNIGVVGVFGEGAGQNYLSDEGGGSSGLFLDYAGINIKPISQINLKAGVIGYQINPLYTTMSPGTSLGAEEKFELATPSETFKFTLQGNQAVPSVGVSKGLTQEDKNPFFLAGSVIGEINAKPIGTKLKVAGTQFRFGNLPKSQAKNSLTSGNSVNSVSGVGDEMQYVIGFAGTEAAATLETDWTSKVKTTAKAVMIQNDRISEANKGRMGRFDLRMVFGNVALKPSVTVFEVEADTTPAGYTILANRYNNRKGQVAGLSLELVKQKVIFFGNYTKADEIVDSPFLSDREIYNIGVEVNYDLF